MKENLTNENIETNEIVTVEEETTMSNDSHGSGSIVKAVVIGGTIAAGALALYLRKTKDKRRAKQIEKLRAEGYSVYEPQPDEVVVDAEEVEEAEAE